MSKELFNTIYYGSLFILICIGIIAVIAGQSRIKLDLPIDKLRLEKKGYKKLAVIFFVVELLLPATLLPLYIFSPKYMLIIQYVILFLTVYFSLLFVTYFQRYWLIRKKLRHEDTCSRSVKKLIK